MYKRYIMVSLLAMLTAETTFADTVSSLSESKPCASIANACLKAGFKNRETGDKKFWQDCMKPIVLGHSVKGVTIDQSIVKDCRTNKIETLRAELDELEKASATG